MLPRCITPCIVILAALLIVAPSVHGQRAKSPVRGRAVTSAAQTPEAKRRLEAFQKVWQVINEHYFDKTFNNLNWAKIKAEYEPKVRAAKTDDEAHRLLHEMINRLGSSHLAIIPPEVYEEIERAKTAAKVRIEKRNARLSLGAAADDEEEEFTNFDDPLSTYGIGVDLRIINGQFVITRVNRNSAAEHAGLKTGYIVEKINELSLSAMLARLSVYYAGSRGLINQIPGEIVSEFINGEKDTSVTLTYLDQSDARKEVSIPRELLRGQAVSIGKGFPDRHLEFEAYQVTPDVGYVRFNQFAMPVVEKFCDAIGQFRSTKGIIIDLRGNGGGIIAAALGLSGMLSETPVDMGTSISKWTEEKLAVSPKLKNYKGRIVFIVDETTASAAEMFAVTFQENGRALVVGEKTAGATLPSVVIDLPTGAMMQYPIANYRSSKGFFLEGKGITPNYPVALDRRSLGTGTDPQLEKARTVILDDKAFAVAAAAAVTGEILKGSVLSGPVPPPPPPAKAPPPPKRVLAEVTIKAPPAAPEKPVVKRKDPEALRIINEFIQISGGREAFTKLDSYEMSGSAQLMVRGASHDFTYAAFKKSSDKYAEIMSSPGLGEIRDMYNGKFHVTQTDFGMTQETPIPSGIDLSHVGIFAHMKLLLDESALSSLTYNGVYTRDGRKTHLISAESESGVDLAFAFDVETKTLLHFTGPYYGTIFTDYRKVDGMTLPFSIERETLMKLRLDSIKINQPIDDTKFAKKINCYDVPN